MSVAYNQINSIVARAHSIDVVHWHIHGVYLQFVNYIMSP